MKYFIYIINCILVVLIPVAFISTPSDNPDVSFISTDVNIKQLNSGDFKELKNKDEDNSLESEEKEDIVEEVNIEKKQDVLVSKEEEPIDNKKEEPVNTDPPVKNDVLETLTGKMSGYGPDCRGCSGYLSNGRYVGDGNIYYNDSTYGKLRIVAGDKSLKFGTVVRVKNSKAGDFMAIVLDRGGSIGVGKTFLFDLLYPSEAEALKYTVSYNVVFEILRYGY